MVIAVLAILISFIIPTVKSAMQAARRAECLSNQQSIAEGIYKYLNDNKDMVPACWYTTGAGAPKDTYWVDRISPYLGGQNLSGASRHPNYGYRRSDANRVFQCAEAENHHYISDIGMNSFVSGIRNSNRISAVPATASTIMLCDARHPSWWAPGGLEYGSWYVNAAGFTPDGEDHSEPADRHGSRTVAAFVDGHAETLKWDDLIDRRLELFGSDYWGSY